MADYSKLPQQGSITIEDAIRAGKRDINYPVRIILVVSATVGVVLPLCGLSLWLLLICIFFGLVAAIVYNAWITPKWRIWAYAGVSDIHQFQRCAELESLLPKQSPMKVAGIMNPEQHATLTRLQKRFGEDVPFIDDPDVDQLSHIYGSLLSFEGSKPVITISREGIGVNDLGFYFWKDIWNEHVGTKSFVRRWGYGYAGTSRSSADYFCFICPDLQVEIPMSSLNTTAGELDHMLYIHRGRYTQTKAGMPIIVPIK